MIPLYKVLRIAKFTETIQVEQWWLGAGERRVTLYCLMIMKFQFGKMKHSEDGWW